MPGARPKYVEIVQDLQAQIDDGRLAPGDALPSETELAERWRVPQHDQGRDPRAAQGRPRTATPSGTRSPSTGPARTRSVSSP
ncbi:GntR family transcriptional regulator [Actinomadura monticuli]|uniref:GntR family transcriptional regulator n=1 Tax=Actinomadura monticuli TaxID=3097367 RepID=UPI003565EDF7